VQCGELTLWTYGDWALYSAEQPLRKQYDRPKPNTYRVEDYFITGPSKYYGQPRDAVKDIVNTNQNICIWAHFGHGSRVAGNLFFYEDLNSLAPSDFNPPYKLAEIVLFACEAGAKDNEWLERVAKGGTLYSTPERIYPVPLPWGWGDLNWWFLYRPLTAHTKE
jgi:hypothetical protein